MFFEGILGEYWEEGFVRGSESAWHKETDFKPDCWLLILPWKNSFA